jgi:hypothetical protein
MSLEAEMAVTDSLETGLLKDTKSGAVIPVIDVGDYFAGVDRAGEKLMPVLRQALTHVGFFPCPLSFYSENGYFLRTPC